MHSNGLIRMTIMIIFELCKRRVSSLELTFSATPKCYIDRD